MEELENFTSETVEDGRIETVPLPLLQIAIFFFFNYDVRSSWRLNDQRHVSSLLIFVGQIHVGGILKPSHIMSNGFSIED